ncbi:MAG: hypothetical protein R2857_12085 [Vampirovibrionales bacterium]
MARHVLGNIIRDSKGDTTTTSDTPIIGDDYKLTRGANSRKYQAAAQRAQEIVEQAITRFEVGRGKTAAEFSSLSASASTRCNDYAQALKVFDDTTIAPGDDDNGTQAKAKCHAGVPDCLC